MSENPSILDNIDSCHLIHRGGEANVYLASGISGKFILKWYCNGSAFETEVIEKLKCIRIPGIYRIRESGVRDGNPYLVYDFVEGENSRDVGRIPAPVALGLLREVAQSLLALDVVGVHHGDLNSANVLLSRNQDKSGFPVRATLVDFGIVGPGTPGYAAPERFQGRPASTASDLFSLGMLLYRWITGEDLIQALEYNEFQAEILRIDSISVDEKLYASGNFTATEISALSPLWKALLRQNAEERCEDFDELDEIAEIALGSFGVGEIKASVDAQKFAETLECQKPGRIPPDGLANGLDMAFPYEKRGIAHSKKKRKYMYLAAFGLILTLMAFFFIVGTNSSDIDETGNLLLEKSRNSVTMEPDSGLDSQDSLPSTILKDLPTPSLD
ncbi:MAG: serine/threonine protein kinase [Fibrobacter sp.]|nr:serine/threonine protein kinase [Fibrobacter sp.]